MARAGPSHSRVLGTQVRGLTGWQGTSCQLLPPSAPWKALEAAEPGLEPPSGRRSGLAVGVACSSVATVQSHPPPTLPVTAVSLRGPAAIPRALR